MEQVSDQDTIGTRKVLQSVIIQVLRQATDGLKPAQVYELIDARYEFPPLWYRRIPKGDAYKELDVDWRSLTEEDLVARVRTEPQWQNEARWARLSLADAGLLDRTIRGIWRLSSEGRFRADEWLDLGPVRKRSRLGGDPSNHMLLADLEKLAAELSTADLALVVDLARAVRRAAR